METVALIHCTETGQRKHEYESGKGDSTVIIVAVIRPILGRK